MNVPEKQVGAAAFAAIDIDVMKTFVAIAETQSFSKAAQRVFRTPSAVSMQIKKMEEVLGVPVFERDSRSVGLTQDGEMLLSYARRIIALSNEMMARFIMPEMEGTVRLGAPDDYGNRILPDLLKRFAETHPNVNIDVVMDNTAPLITRFEEGEIDVMLYTSSSENAMENDAIIAFEEDLVWAGAKNGSAHLQEPLPVSMWEKTCAWRRRASDSLDKSNRSYRMAYKSAHSIVQRSAVAADLAVAPMPKSFIEEPLVALGEKDGMPPIGTYQIRMRMKENASCCSQAVADHMLACFEAI